jgi:hypothetical protein
MNLPTLSRSFSALTICAGLLASPAALSQQNPSRLTFDVAAVHPSKPSEN